MFEKKIHIFFLLFSLLLLIPFLSDPHIVHANDLNGTDLHHLFFKDAIIKLHTFPQWNPYMQQGVPMIADPLYSMYNPVISLPILVSPTYDFAVKIIYVVSIYFACETMYLLVRKFTKSLSVSFFIALTYASSGFIAARITAGHIESVVPYGILPLVIFSLLKVVEYKNIFWSGIAALTLTYILYSGNVYFVLYGLYGIFGLSIYFIFKDKKTFVYLCFVVVLFVLFSSVKIFPNIELQKFLEKTKDPFLGSQTVISVVRYMFIPFDQFFQPLQLSRFISTAWGDLEKTAFVGIFPLFGIYWGAKNYKRLKVPYMPFIIIIFCVFLLILMPQWNLNPLHYLILIFSPLQYFRVPSRAYAYFIVIVLLIFAIASSTIIQREKYKKFILLMLVANLFSTIIFFEVMIARPSFFAYPVDHLDYSLYSNIFSWIERDNKNDGYILVENYINEVPEDVAYSKHQRLLNTNYGFLLKNSPASHFAFVKRPSPYNFAYSYYDIKPGYIITPHNSIIDMPSEAIEAYRVKETSVWKIPLERPFAIINSESNVGVPESVQTGVNTFQIMINSTESATLSLAEMNYPGWNIFIDGKKESLLPERFLETRVLPGKHMYLFSFSSKTFLLGMQVSIVSFIVWISFCIFLRKKKS